MLKKQSTSQIPSPPRGIGLSRRLIVSIAVFIFLVMVLFLVFLKHYAPHPNALRYRLDCQPLKQIFLIIFEFISNCRASKVLSITTHFVRFPTLACCSNKFEQQARLHYVGYN